MKKTDDVRSWVQDYYGTILKTSQDLKTNACCATGAPPRHVAVALSNVHEAVLERFYGCGFPIPEVLQDATVVDLGSGSGRDVFLLSQLVGPQGFVHGVDMTDEQLAVACQHTAWHMDRFGYAETNVAFHQGYIEQLDELPLEEGSVDVIVSNCVVNLSPRKDIVLEQALRLLKPGGEFYLSDVLVDRRLPEAIAFDPVLHSECLGGAMYAADFLSLARRMGFCDPRVMTRAPITIQSEEIEAKVGAAQFESVTLRLFKLEGLDEQCEDYGQIATYRGTIDSSPHLYRLDDHHVFEAHRPERVCGNTAAMLQETRLGEHFDVLGDKKRHFGEFPCLPTMAASQYLEDEGSLGSGGSCC